MSLSRTADPQQPRDLTWSTIGVGARIKLFGLVQRGKDQRGKEPRASFFDVALLCRQSCLLFADENANCPEKVEFCKQRSTLIYNSNAVNGARAEWGVHDPGRRAI